VKRSGSRGGRGIRVAAKFASAGHSLSPEVREKIASLPQVASSEWSKSYLAEQVWRNFLGLPSDYDAADLEMVRNGNIIV
jgi:hypothetical protein